MTTDHHNDDAASHPFEPGPHFGPSHELERRRLELRGTLMRRTIPRSTLAQVQETLLQRNHLLLDVEELHKDLQVEFFKELASDKADALNTPKLREMIYAYQQAALAINRMMDEIIAERVQLLINCRSLAKDELETRPNSAFHDEMPQRY